MDILPRCVRLRRHTSRKHAEEYRREDKDSPPVRNRTIDHDDMHLPAITFI